VLKSAFSIVSRTRQGWLQHDGSEFHAAGPACEKERSPNLVRSCGVEYLLLEADGWPVRVAALMHVRMMSLRYAGHLPVCIAYTLNAEDYELDSEKTIVLFDCIEKVINYLRRKTRK